MTYVLNTDFVLIFYPEMTQIDAHVARIIGRAGPTKRSGMNRQSAKQTSSELGDANSSRTDRWTWRRFRPDAAACAFSVEQREERRQRSGHTFRCLGLRRGSSIQFASAML